jgi:hypothetical protein
MAAINLLLLAAVEGYRDAFDQYRLILDRAPLPVRLRASYYEELGDGLTAFGEASDAHMAYVKLARLAEKHGMRYEAERAFESLRGTRRVYLPVTLDVIPPEIEGLLHEVTRVSQLSYRLAPTRAFSAPRGPLATQLRRGRRPIITST